jgi:hypothetical protein
VENAQMPRAAAPRKVNASPSRMFRLEREEEDEEEEEEDGIVAYSSIDFSVGCVLR